MSDTAVLDEKKVRPFSLPRFLVVNTFNLAFLMAAFWAVSTLGASLLGVSNRFWEAQFASGWWWKYLVLFLPVLYLDSHGEFYFHRYFLHRCIFPFLRSLYKAHHCIHHPITNIVWRKTRGGKNVPFLEEESAASFVVTQNNFPITKKEQNEAAFFPWYSLLVFGGIATLLLALPQWLMPTFPWILTGYGALFFALTVYEVFHAILHWPFERWEPLFEHPRLSKFFLWLYGFHVRHHVSSKCNLGIFGVLFGYHPDRIAGTYVKPTVLYRVGENLALEDVQVPKPRGFIRLLDWLADWMEFKMPARAGQ